MSVVKVQHVLASKCAATGERIDTLICEYPRAIHSQLLTHRAFSKNSSSTRAIPIAKAVENILNNPAQPIWTHKQKGMQGKVVGVNEPLYAQAQILNSLNQTSNINFALALDEIGIHKQNAGRCLEPFQNIRIVLTSTEWENWDWLRIDGAAQGEIKELADAIYKARLKAEVQVLQPNEYHLPFITAHRDVDNKLRYYIKRVGLNSNKPVTREYTLANAIKISQSICAQTSYRNTDDSLEKAEDLCGKLFDGNKVHASPTEHQACPIGLLRPEHANFFKLMADLPKGVTHVDRYGQFWSGNFKGWNQVRQVTANHDKAHSNREAELSADAHDDIDDVLSYMFGQSTQK